MRKIVRENNQNIEKTYDLEFKKYLQNKDLTIGGKKTSRRYFIRTIANSEGSHSDKNIAYEIALGKNFKFNGIPLNNLQIVNIAEVILSAGLNLIKTLKNNHSYPAKIFK